MGQTRSVCISSDCTLPIFRYSELAKATKNFSDRLRGRGVSNSKVYYGQLKDGRHISVETYDLFTFMEFKKAQILMSRLFHRNLVSIYGYSNLNEEKFVVVQEYISNGTLADYLYGELAAITTLPWLTRLDIAIDVANALAYLHIHGIIHGDITPNNILLNMDLCAKVRLEASSIIERDSDDDYHKVIGTPGYLDPHYFATNKLDFYSDVYSFGVVLCQLLSSKYASYFCESSEQLIALSSFAITKVQNGELDGLMDPRLGFQSDDKIKQMMSAVANLAIKCLQDSANLRPSITQVRDHLQNIKEENLQFRTSTNNQLENATAVSDRIGQENLQSQSFSDKQIEDATGSPQIQIFTYNELEDATVHFHKCLGKGAFGVVYYGKLEDGREIAAKRFLEKKDKTTMQQFAKEVEVLSHIRHQHLVSLYGYCSDLNEELILVYEYISNATLSIHLRLHSSGQLSWLTRLNIAIQTASALAYLHESGIIHRDVKASNILLDDNFNVKVADFGLSRFLPRSGSQGNADFASHVTTAPQGTYGYMDPEYISSNRVSDKSDVYSFGVVLFELISSKPPAFTDGPQYVTLANFAMNKILNNALEELVDPKLQFNSGNGIMETITAAAELAFQCVQCPKELRPSMKQVLDTLEGVRQGRWGFNQIT